MKSMHLSLPGGTFGRVLPILALALSGAVLSACGGGPRELPRTRPIVIRSGARVYPDTTRLVEIDAWFRAQMENIDTDPTFWIITHSRDTPAYPWETLHMHADSAEIALETGKSADAELAYQLYAHYHLMKEFGRLDEFLPGAGDAEGFALERAILERVADAWLLGRGVYDAEAYDPLEEILYANENGYLEALILTARSEEFREERQMWLQEDPGVLEKYRSWFLETFDREPPGLRGTG